MLSKTVASKSSTPVTYIYAGCCVVITVAGMFLPFFREYFGIYDQVYEWPQLFTVGFQHGFDAISAALHLSFNLFILLHLGMLAERLLGSGMTAVTILASMLTYAFVHQEFDMVGHGSSGVIWAFAPVALFAMIESRKADPENASSDHYYRTLRQILFVIWVLVTMIMAGIPMSITDNQIGMGQALFYGNLFHISATLTGFAIAILNKRKIAETIKADIPVRAPERWGVYLILTVPVFLTGWALFNA